MGRLISCQLPLPNAVKLFNCRGNTDLSLDSDNSINQQLPKRRITDLDITRENVEKQPHGIFYCHTKLYTIYKYGVFHHYFSSLTLDSSNPCSLTNYEIVLKAVSKIGNSKAAAFVSAVNTPPSYHLSLVHFSERLIQSLNSIIPSQLLSGRSKSHQAEREALWTSLHSLRNSSAFHDASSEFLLGIKINPQPSIYQHITQNIINLLIDNQFNESSSNITTSSQSYPFSCPYNLNNIE